VTERLIRTLKALAPSAIEKKINGGKCDSRELRRRQLKEKARREEEARAAR